MDLLTIDAASDVAPFEQVRRQLTAAIRDGRLAPETRLPTVRALAGDLGLAVNTVARSYKELELAGLIETRGRNGTFVAGADADTPAARATRDFVAACALSAAVMPRRSRWSVANSRAAGTGNESLSPWQRCSMRSTTSWRPGCWPSPCSSSGRRHWPVTVM